MLEIRLKNEILFLLPEKAIYWPKQKAILISDLHLGKTNHLRKSGYALSHASQFATLEILDRLLKDYLTERLIMLGDLFHSTVNNEWNAFSDFRKLHGKIRFDLVLGNHDIMPQEFYQNIDLITHSTLELNPFIFSHEPLSDKSFLFNLYGHIHPGILLRGKGRMKTKLSCFYFEENQGILPAFGTLTGLAKLKVKRNARVFAINYPDIITLSE